MPHDDDALFKALMDTAVDGIVVIDTRGIVQVCSEACGRLFGYRPDEVAGRNVRMLMPEPYHGEHDAYISSYLRTGEKRIIGSGREVVGRRKDGSTFPMYLSVGEGEVGGNRIFVGVIHDLTPLKAEVARRMDLDSLLAQIVQSSDDAILSKTLAGTITSWNASAERIFGYAAGEVIGANIAMLIPQDRLAEEQDIIDQIRAGRDVEHFETVRRHKNGSDIHVSITISPLRDGAGDIVGASKIVRDVSEKKRSELRMQTLQSEIAHINRLSSMGQMSSAIAHELNQPLTAIANYVKAARRTLDRAEPASVDRAKDAMDKAGAQILRAGAIIRNLRDFIEKRDSNRSPEDLNNVVEEAIALGLVGTAHVNVRLCLQLEPKLPPVLIDKVQIQQVLINLIRNGLEAMQVVDIRELTIETAIDNKDFARVTVHDSGPGLSEAVLKRLFQPFVTTKEKGMGIGLTICQSILEAHGGNIVALPDHRPGATFRFRVPFVGQREAA
ncbi:MAG: PAS domain S-box protein [Rhizomicrobium sp.]